MAGRTDAPADSGLDTKPDAVTDVGVDGKKAVALAVTPPVITLAVGGTDNFNATVTFSDGTTADVTALATWTSSDQRVATVRAGRVTALVAGKIMISASYMGLGGGGVLVVVPTISLVSVTVDPPVATLTLGSSVAFTVTGTYSDGSTMDVTAMAKWTSSTGDVAAVDVTGRVTARRAGITTITATVGTQAGKALVTVSPATVVQISVQPPLANTGIGATAAFTADAILSDGSVQDVTGSATWSTDDPAVAVVDGSGVATGKVAGKTLVRASFGGQSGSAVLVVTGAMLTMLQVEPVDPTVGVGVSFNFTATGIFSDGTKVDLTAQANWQSSAPGVVAIDLAGHAVSKSVGTSVISASSGGLTGQSTVTVSPAALTLITVSPPSSTLTVGGTAGLHAFGTYSDGSILDLTDTVTWTAAPAGVVSVSNAATTAGVATALAPGTATVTATSGLLRGTAKIVVSLATLQAIAIAPASTSVPIGAVVGLTAKGTFSDGTSRDVTAEVAWASTNDATATVSNAAGSAGAVTGVSAGDVTITATLMGVAGKASVTVVAATLKAIDLGPANASTTAGLRYSYTATGTYSDGSKIDVTAQVTWSTANTNVATISNVAGAEGQLLARAPGSTTVTATLGAVSGQTGVTVTGATNSSLSISPIAVSTPIGNAVQYTATLILTNGTTRNVTGQTMWSSSNTMAATISGFGRAVPVAVGTTTISATYMGLSATTALTVTSAVVTSIEVTPIAPTVPVGTVTQFTATAIFSDLTTRNVTAQATWVSSAPGVLGVNTARNRGRGTAVSVGTALVTATYMGLSGSTLATVTDAVVVQISVSPMGLTLPVGMRRQFTAQAIRSDGTSLTVTGQATWTSDAPGVAAVSTSGGSRGLVTAIANGTANIQATYMGITGSVLVTVSAATLTSIQVTPFNPTVSLNTSLQFAATGLYSDGSSAPLTGMATWQSSNGAVAGVSNAGGSRGLATSLSKGTSQISATFAGVTGATTLSVTDATIVQIQVTPFDPSIPAGFQQQLTATAIYSDGSNRNITAQATWTSTAMGVAQVSDALATKGFVNAIAGGTATIEAQYTGVSGSTDVTVSAALLKAIEIAPADASIAVGEILQLTATGVFDDGSRLALTTFVTWTSSDTDAADVSNADGSRGQASGFSSGPTTIKAQRGAVIGATSLTVK
jgi:trimeric autotransporter adhesin